MPARNTLLADPARAGASARTPSPRVLIVDDDQAFTETLADLLSLRGYSPLVAGAAAQALRLVRNETVDLALVDIRLPDMSGLDLLDALSRSSPTTATVVLTGHGSVDTAVQALSRGASGYVQKPYDIERLFVLLEKVLSSQRSNGHAQSPTAPGRLLQECPIAALTINSSSGTILAANRALVEMRSDSRAAERDIFDLIGSHAEAGRIMSELQAGRSVAHDLILHTDSGPRRYCLHGSPSRERPHLALILLCPCPATASGMDLDRTRAKYEAIFESLGAAVAVIDFRYSIQMVNPAFARLHNTTPAQVVGQRCYQFIHRHPTPCHFHGELCPLKSCLVTGSVSRARHRHIDEAGRVSYVDGMFAPLRDEDGTIVSMVGVFADAAEPSAPHRRRSPAG